MAKTQHNEITPNPDLLAAVVLHTLVSEGRDGLSAQQVAKACERDPANPAEMQEVEVALGILIRDQLACRDDDMFAPTRAAVRASELSF